MKRVAITYHREEKVEPYAAAVRASGMEPVLLKAGRDTASLDGVDGLLLSGGVDVDPALYTTEPPAPETERPVKERDELERTLLLQALSKDLPVLAICRGLQLMNVCHGGTLVQHYEGHKIPSNGVHEVDLEPGSRLAAIYGASELRVNSRHHQIVGRVGANLAVAARSKWDGVVEGLERSDRRFAIAVQWHPEDQISQYPEQLKLFEAFRDCL
jgi:gamma-glutamyl-gamma-aminobutyrate hydrolase PuuD